ncbi:MAG: transglycosylase SLT domain-containing protein [Nanoarchaeota archaeon]|nr:transglycosylase SLT domain-containing protein [Nanoarchaeota archaeon]
MNIRRLLGGYFYLTLTASLLDFTTPIKSEVSFQVAPMINEIYIDVEDLEEILRREAQRVQIVRAVPSSQKYLEAIMRNSYSNGLDPFEVVAVIERESRWNPKAKSEKNARGLMQLRSRYFNLKDPYDPIESIKVGTSHLSRLKGKYSDSRIYLAAYNAGEGAVNNWLRGGWDGSIHTIPYRETRNYVRGVIRTAESLRHSNL